MIDYLKYFLNHGLFALAAGTRAGHDPDARHRFSMGQACRLPRDACCGLGGSGLQEESADE